MKKVLLLALLCSSLNAVDAGDQKKAGEASRKVIMPDDFIAAMRDGQFEQVLAWIDEDPTRRINAQEDPREQTFLTFMSSRYIGPEQRAFIKELLARNINVNLLINSEVPLFS